jgi:hypothetical protein
LTGREKGAKEEIHNSITLPKGEQTFGYRM